ncbi:hypothetical protein THASP1DRAFT_28090 [Thamnocephalis sphaerospora]|uniref:Uncharacterized protein n=1 Tax=Thamnocephalis sphaerospora TaxID=78915 RepID=A0A4P9XV33_9FUNG|nr:hypothetical protein THASP1DRAFT_28090 [Thamnocephalis sphaerospora]|eukprot:RKP10113.1 hypothetical protein THASP1DRAFT_28090 [Thamnocephalis sphaerospora]
MKLSFIATVGLVMASALYSSPAEAQKLTKYITNCGGNRALFHIDKLTYTPDGHASGRNYRASLQGSLSRALGNQNVATVTLKRTGRPDAHVLKKDVTEFCSALKFYGFNNCPKSTGINNLSGVRRIPEKMQSLKNATLVTRVRTRGGQLILCLEEKF